MELRKKRVQQHFFKYFYFYVAIHALIAFLGGNTLIRGHAGQSGDIEAVFDRGVLLYAAIHGLQSAADRQVLATYAHEASF